MKLEPKPSTEHVLSFQNTILSKTVSEHRSGAVTVSDGKRCLLDLPDIAGAEGEGLAAPTQRPQRSLAWKARFVFPGTLGESLTRSWAECGLGMEPGLELLMHPEISGSVCLVVGRPTEDISLWTSPALAQRTKAWGLSGGTHFRPNPVSLHQLGPGEKGLAWFTFEEVCQMC